jgi:DNA excision repair protein ERCC-2
MKSARKSGRALKSEDKVRRLGQELLPQGYELRRGQMEFVEESSSAVRSGHVFFGNAPCGIGKSLASLLAVLPHLGENKLVITFRTRSQLHIYLKELEVLGTGLPTVSLFSKQSMCPLRLGGNLSYSDFFDECRRLKANCEPLEKPYCRFYLKNLKKEKETEKLAMGCAERLLSPPEATDLFVRDGFCAYEALRSILRKVKVFLGTYGYVFNPNIRKFMFKDFGVGLDRVYLIVDEAHNVPAFARELLSNELGETGLDRALKETERFRHEDAASIQELLELLDEEVFRHAHKSLREHELKRVLPRDIEDLFLRRCGISGVDAAKAFMEYGESVKHKKEELGQENLLSYNSGVGKFLEGFFGKSDAKYIHLIRRDREDVVLEVRNFDGREVTDPVLTEARGSLLMSGSLSPPQIYRDLVLHDGAKAVVRELDSPFPSENRLILGAGDVSSRFELRTEAMFEKWKGYLEAISRANKGNVAFFFTSYEMMHSVLRMVRLKRNVIVEERGTRRNSVLTALQRSCDNALFGVMGGKLSEGIDYPDNVLTCVVAVGFPYATWDVYQKGLIDYYENQFPGDGETYAYLTPAVLRLIQASGRVHRSPEDRGCIIMLDERITKPRVMRQFPRYFQQELKIVRNVGECSRRIEEFWQ